MKKILFINRKERQCGVHQYGVDTYESISKIDSFDFSYKDVSSFEDIQSEFGKYDIYIYNYNPLTLKFLDVNSENKSGGVNIGVLHETPPRYVPDVKFKFFDYLVMGDCSLQIDRKDFFIVPRNIKYLNCYEPNKIPVIGTFGFATPGKGHRTIFNHVQKEFDEAIIRINCPPADFYSFDVTGYKRVLESFIYKPNIKLEYSTDFMTPEETIKFLSKNDINAFFYDYQPQGGIASSLDYALGSKRPLAITRCMMFRHILKYNLPITIEDINLRSIMDAGTIPLSIIYKDWNETKFIEAYEKILCMI